MKITALILACLPLFPTVSVAAQPAEWTIGEGRRMCQVGSGGMNVADDQRLGVRWVRARVRKQQGFAGEVSCTQHPHLDELSAQPPPFPPPRSNETVLAALQNLTLD